MQCKGVIQELTDFLDGNLDSALADDLRHHLDKCTDCRLVVNTCRKTIEIYCNSEPLPLPAGVRERLERALADKLNRRP